VGVRIVCSGLVDADAGSVASAGFIVLRELLARGHEIDFYSKRSFVFPEQLMAHPAFRYVDHPQPQLDRVARRFTNPYARWTASRLVHATYARRIVRRMREMDGSRNYELQLSWGQWAYGRASRIPVISWVQGPPGTDSRSVVRHQRRVKQLCGSHEYARLRAYALYRASLGRPQFRHTDIAISGSHWSKAFLMSEYGLPDEQTRALPYPIDLDAFTPAPGPRRLRPLDIVWIGRVIPRKRLDLFLDAGAELISSGRDIRLTVAGSFPFAAGFRRLLDTFSYPERLTYVPHLPRTEVLALLQKAAVLLQPSEEEDFGSSVAEALACGTPVVVGPTNGMRDYIDAGSAQFAKYRVDDVVSAVSTVLDRLDAHPEQMCDQARLAALSHFSVTHVADELEALFEQVLRV
jgi:glycosyltransferase involved in cell wall biosynthesis